MEQALKETEIVGSRISEGYESYLSLRETEKEIDFIKDFFRTNLAEALNLSRVSAPMIVSKESGINDNLNNIEKPVSVDAKSIKDKLEIVQSLAKWKRCALADYSFKQGEGLYTNMNALRPDEDLSQFHSIYVDQWDWEKVISEEERNVDFLIDTVEKIYEVLKKTEKMVQERNAKLPTERLPENIFFIHAQELEDRYPELSPKEREYEICREKKAVFIIGIGGTLKSGNPHDGRAADYDDWSSETDGRKGLNGDIMVWNNELECALELSSMGIRVDKEVLMHQLKIKNEEFKKELPFHKRLLADELPLSIGGGIGQSRLCMFFLRKVHIGEVQSSIWDERTLKICKDNGIKLL